MQRGPSLTKVAVAIGAVGLVALGLKWFSSVGTGASGQPIGSAGRSGTAGASIRSGGTAPPSVPGSVPAGGRTGELIVQVAGLVRHPGVYRLPAGARTFQALEAAGGALRRGDPNSLQLAARLADGARIAVPPRAPTASGASAVQPAVDPAGGAASGPVSLSSATAEQLEQLDGIGPAMAKRIIEWRQAHGGFSAVSDLDRIPGIGPAKFAALKDSVVP